MGLWAFNTQDGIPQWTVEIIITTTNMDVQEVIDVVEKEVDRCVVFVVVQA